MSNVICGYCKKEFVVSSYYLKKGRGKYCSKDCYLKARFGTGKCQLCNNPSEYRFCSDKCRKDYWNKNEYKIYKKSRYWEDKIKLIETLGGKCSKCGCNDYRVLDIHHINPDTKHRLPKGDYTWSWQRRRADWKANEGNLILVCANCHRVITWEKRGYGKLD